MGSGSNNPNSFYVADYIIFILFLVLSTAIGLYHAFVGGRQKTTAEYLMGGRNLRTLPVAISIVASVISGILILGHPAEVYTRGSQFTMRIFGHMIASVLASYTVVPLFFHLKVTSAFEVGQNDTKYRSIILILFN